MKKVLSKKIAENLGYYVGKDKRCKDPRDGICKYSGKTLNKDTEGCFVGRLLSEEARIKVDALGNMGVHTLIASVGKKNPKLKGVKIPTIITSNANLMADFQIIHDNNDYWTDFELSEYGKSCVKGLVTKYNLNPKDFEKFY